MTNSLTAFSEHLAAVVAQAGERVVSVDARPRTVSSGIILRPGIVITADHTIRRQDDIRVMLPSGEQVEAEIAGRDPGTDLAVLRAERASITEDGAAEAIRPGDLAVAVGRAEQGLTASMGIVSTVGGAWRTWRGGLVDQFVRLDLSLYSSSSGAAVVDASGRLVGMATAGLSRTSAIAIPWATLKHIADELLAKGHVARAYLGVGLQPVPLPRHLRDKLQLREQRGVIVLSVEPESPAGTAGITIGDVLLQIDGRPLGDTDDVQAALGAGDIGRIAQVSLVRGGELKLVEVRIAERPFRAE